MVEPVNYQHTLARTQIAEKMQEAAKEQNLGAKDAFADELGKLEKVRERQVQHTEQDQEGVKVRQEDKKKRHHEGGEPNEDKGHTPGETAPGGPEAITDDPDHHIDITA